jgi:hypothetical protein
MEVELPEAEPELYLRWIAFEVALEQALRGDPRLRARAARRRLVYGRSAQAAHRFVYQPITTQAEQADADGIGEVRPTVTAGRRELANIVRYLQRWGDWLVEEDIPERAGVALPLPDVAALRTQVIKAITGSLSGL